MYLLVSGLFVFHLTVWLLQWVTVHGMFGETYLLVGDLFVCHLVVWLLHLVIVHTVLGETYQVMRQRTCALQNFHPCKGECKVMVAQCSPLL